MVGANFQGFIPPHDKADLLVVLVGQKSNISCTTLFPLEIGFVESEELGSPISPATSA
jgi:hypothetical protein